jgi:Domain of unknown function (DUF5658)
MDTARARASLQWAATAIRGLQTQKNKFVPNDVKDRERASARAGLPERRRGERRSQILRALLYGSFRPRRRGPRRAAERLVSALDWHHPQWLAVSMLIVIGSCTDALLTLVLVGRGIAIEANPLMAPLVGDSPLAFALVKVALTAGGVVLLTQLARIRAFGRIPAGMFLYLVLAIYGIVILYELKLLDML